MKRASIGMPTKGYLHTSLWLDIIVVSVIGALLIAFYAAATINMSVNIGGRLYPTFGDDTYISMRYARHLVQGHGLVWNIGEKPIEGYTNFLWVLWIAMLMLFVSDPSFLMIASGVIFHLLSVLLIYVFLRKTFRTSVILSTIAGLLLTVYQPIRTQVLNALEMPMLLFLFVAAIYLLFNGSTNKHRIILGSFLAGLLPLVRPDGLVLLMILLTGFALQHLMPLAETRRRALEWKWALFCFVGPFILCTMWRWLYFDDWLPNTFYLKVLHRPGRIAYGIDYVRVFLKSFYGTMLIIPLALYALFEARRWIKPMGIGIIGILIYVAYQGGDAWQWWRFMIPVLPLFLITLASLSERCRVHTSLRMMIIGIWCVITALDIWSVYKAIKNDQILPTPSQQTADNIRLGLLLAKVCDSDALTADFWAGATPYYSGLRSIDMLGRSDRHIARLIAHSPGMPPGHDKFDFEYVLNRQPDVIISNHPLKVTNEELANIRQSNYPFGAILLENREFREKYMPVETILSIRWHGIFMRRGSDKCEWSRAIAEELTILQTPCSWFMVDGWYYLERESQNWWRWTAGRGALKVFVRQDTNGILSGEIASIQRPNRVDVLLGGEEVGTLNMNGEEWWLPFGPLTLPLRAGENTIEFVSHNTAITIPTDSRPLAIAVRNLHLQAEGGQICELQP